jgi:voltage-gated potassium channel
MGGVRVAMRRSSRLWSAVAATTSTIRARVYAILRYSDNSPDGRRWRSFHLFILGSGLLAVTLSSIESLPDFVDQMLAVVIALVAAVFLVEYVLRLWTAPEAPGYGDLPDKRARLRWAFSATGLIGLLAVVPALAITTRTVKADSDLAAIFCILWILKLSIHAPAMGTLMRVISNESARLASVLIVFIIILVAAATATHFFERDRQPELFGSLPAALWWAVVTLTTTGYGDVVPHTIGGKMVGSVVMVSGILVLALMTGILATSFSEEERRREYLRVWDQVIKVPMFTELGTVTLSEIVSKLRVRHYPPRFVVVRRDEPGDSMFFISEGEVEVRLPREPVRLGPGGFFGEMALLDRLPRSATIVTTQPTTLLVLYASDFYQIASHIPSLVAAVEKEARRRRQENEAGNVTASGTQ